MPRILSGRKMKISKSAIARWIVRQGGLKIVYLGLALTVLTMSLFIAGLIANTVRVQALCNNEWVSKNAVLLNGNVFDILSIIK